MKTLSLITMASLAMLLGAARFTSSAAICPGNVGEFEDGEPGSLRWALNIAGPGATITFCPHIIGKITLTNQLVLTNPANWGAVSASITQSNNLNQVTIPLPPPPHFYRLALSASP